MLSKHAEEALFNYTHMLIKSVSSCNSGITATAYAGLFS